MGTRSSNKIKLRTPLFKCDICARRLMTAESLRTHQFFIHNITNKLKTKPASKQGITKPKSQAQVQKTNRKTKIIKQKPLPPRKLPESKPDNKIPVKTGKSRNKNVETCNEYECPKCFQTFPVYFVALRHIQKYHCVDSDNEKVSPNSPNIIKPDTLVVCIKCNRRPKSIETHKCATYRVEQIPVQPISGYICMGCNEQFQSLRLFDLHVSGLHCDGVESMFFPSNEVFQSWKDDVLKQNGVEYNVLGNYNYKNMLRCPCIPDNPIGDIAQYLCPSTIVVQELPKGIQVHFYKNHYGHMIGNYVLPEQYKKYTLSKLIQNEEAYTLSDDTKANETEMYQKFKQLMDCIIQDAANIKIDSLKALVNKALDMTTVLSEEDNSDTNFQSIKMILDNNIQDLISDQGKRKSVIVKQIEPITKRFKTRTYQKDDTKANLDGSIKIINSYSLSQEQSINAGSDDNDTGNRGKVTPEVDSESSLDKKIKVESKDLQQSPSSFADSYKVFVKQLSQPGAPPLRKQKPHMKQIKTEPIYNEIVVKQEIVENENGFYKDLPVIPVEYKYEVKEQENDCNILILKF